MIELVVNPIEYGATHNLGHGVRVVCGFQFQPGALDILLQQAQPNQAMACTLANKVNQILRFRAPTARQRVRALLDDTQGTHGLRNTYEAGDVGPHDIVARHAILVSRAGATVVNVSHDLCQTHLGLFERPTVA